ncbi:ATP-binding protein [Amycolatopsis sp. NPDC051071]|uniref:ATP-binding protein n=1 Tax=Amycolatopsis sp. NPDC051071 TaxID=3154637 RepID=UPI003433BB95
MVSFQGRTNDLALLDRQLRVVRDKVATTSGQAVIVTGRRRVGKSRLVQEFCDRSGVPYVVFQASRGRNPAAERADFTASLAQSALPGADLVAAAAGTDWNQALRALAIAVPEHEPSIVVLDEVPWLVEQDSEFEGALQTVWDRYLSAKPVLLLLVGSDLSMMESLQEYGRPFHGRAARMLVRPLDPGDVQEMTALDSAEAFDAFLITGGFPEIIQRWKPGTGREAFLHDQLTDPLSPLLMAGELSLLGEFPESSHSRSALEAIGTGERTFGTIANRIGAGDPIPSGTLAPILNTLVTKRIIAVDTPLATRPDTRNKRYRIEDPYLRFWLAFLRRGIAEVERGRGDLVAARIERSWTSWRGRAVEPVIRTGLARLLPDDRLPGAEVVGGWWNRQNNPEIDLVGADRDHPAATHIAFTGSIKWLETEPFGRRELESLLAGSMSVPGRDYTTPLVAVSRSGFEEGLPLAATFGPDDLIGAWRR